MGLLKTAIGLPFVRSFILGQARNGAAIAGGYFAAHGLSAGYTPDQITGALCCLAAVAFQAADNFIVHGKIADALATPAPTTGA